MIQTFGIADLLHDIFKNEKTGQALDSATILERSAESQVNWHYAPSDRILNGFSEAMFLWIREYYFFFDSKFNVRYSGPAYRLSTLKS